MAWLSVAHFCAPTWLLTGGQNMNGPNSDMLLVCVGKPVGTHLLVVTGLVDQHQVFGLGGGCFQSLCDVIVISSIGTVCTKTHATRSQL